ncbi:hypothetical protein AOQ84DRAFT_387654 [Glonium stellatum]|uniref:Tat pathway signal sequence n=1 Tax=Glonium stellatum TaxID=574774 RepID=A0A8E2F4M6_9PEZI|nr:hypothetical protein AOQ84DRAFT_387654 [Glonium stellatum]
MDAHQEFHNLARRLKPDQQISAKRYWVGILHHDISPDDVSSEADFLWIKAHSRITVQTIEDQYIQRYPSIEIVLKFAYYIPPKSATLPDLDYWNDKIIIFRAVELTSPEAHVGFREPLQPVNRQAVARPSMPPSNSVKPEPKPLAETQPLLQSVLENLQAPTLSTSSNGLGSRASISPIVPEKPQDENDAFGPIGRLPPYSDSDGNTPVYELSIPKTKSTSTKSLTPVSTPKSLGLLVKAEPDRGTPPAPYSCGLNESSQDPPMMESSFDNPGPQPEDGRPKNENLLELMAETSPEKLEAGVRKGLDILNTLKARLMAYEGSGVDAQQWLKSIENLQKQAVQKQTVVGVVGNTGAGKSSVINALLDEERLVPTNCMRACTAVVTEMSWNDSKKRNSKYRAEIEFITRQDWEKELDTLLKDLLDSNGEVSRECRDQDSESGIAWAKFKAVYPQKTKEMLAKSDVKSLMQDKSLLNILGTTKKISEADPEPFYRRLQTYVDSKEKVTGKEPKEKKKKEKRKMEFWPLIKVVKIYAKSPALSTGAVIVDLPGVHDSNAARAAVAQGYMKQCTGLWIVAPINRAVDDKAAKSLLGESFKRQLKYDGTYSNVTFICSKTDDISITEASDSLGLNEQIYEFDDQKIETEKQISSLQNNIKELRESKEVYKDIIDDADDEQEIWEKLRDEVDDGKTAYAPKPKSEKRKRGFSEEKQRKRRQRSGSGSGFGSESDGSDTEASDELGSEGDDRGAPLTAEQIRSKLEEIKNTKKNARRERQDLEQKIKDTRKEIEVLKQKEATIIAEMSAICIAGRNQYSKGAIQQDFAAGIKELDQENAIEEDEANFDPDEDIRDYDEVARSLPVFCVSSRAYQKLCGRLKKDNLVPGFKTVEETEIPQLQTHCKKLTEVGRASSCRTFLNSLSQLFNSLTLWSSNDGLGVKLTDVEKQKEAHFLEKKLQSLESGLEKAVADCVNDMKQALTENIYDKFRAAINKCVAAAPGTAGRWGAHKSMGGLFWGTYKATVRRNGVFAGASGPRDFNAELNEPITKQLATGWERAFRRRLPHVLNTYTKQSNALLTAFHQAVEARSRHNGAGIARLNMLAGQLRAYSQVFANLAAAMVEQMTTQQRDANREFTPVIGAAMETVYRICADESGKGSYKRMKDTMVSYVDKERHTMFFRATEAVKHRLTLMCTEIEELMSEKADEVFLQMRRDYMTTIGGAHLSQGDLMPKAERTVRRDVLDILNSADEKFRAVLEGEVKIVKEDEADQDNEEPEEEINDDNDSDTDSDAEEEIPQAESSSAVGASNSHNATVDVKMEDAPDDGTGVQPDTEEM